MTNTGFVTKVTLSLQSLRYRNQCSERELDVYSSVLFMNVQNRVLFLHRYVLYGVEQSQ